MLASPPESLLMPAATQIKSNFVRGSHFIKKCQYDRRRQEVLFAAIAYKHETPQIRFILRNLRFQGIKVGSLLVEAHSNR